jgi:hypothetical protein
MNCVQFESGLSDYLEGIHTSEQQVHLNSCSACSGMLADLNFISSQAASLREFDEPSPRVWNGLEIQLRREGLIRETPAARPSTIEFFRRWRTAWLVPAAAALVIVAGVKLYQPNKAGDTSPVSHQVAKQIPSPQVHAPSSVISVEDKEILSMVASRPPAQQASYKHGLEQANAFIRDAEQMTKDDPNDEEAQQMLVNAYQQKQMLFTLASDRGGE